MKLSGIVARHVQDVLRQLEGPRYRGPLRVVARQPTPLWADLRWKRHGNVLRGYYRFQGVSFRGEICIKRPAAPQFYVLDNTGFFTSPDACHRACFRSDGRGKGWWSIHFLPAAKDVDSGLAAVQNVMRETLQHREA